jgi:hypothetical protein
MVDSRHYGPRNDLVQLMSRWFEKGRRAQTFRTALAVPLLVLALASALFASRDYSRAHASSERAAYATGR